jgi:hypothetical protein
MRNAKRHTSCTVLQHNIQIQGHCSGDDLHEAPSATAEPRARNESEPHPDGQKKPRWRVIQRCQSVICKKPCRVEPSSRKSKLWMLSLPRLLSVIGRRIQASPEGEASSLGRLSDGMARAHAGRRRRSRCLASGFWLLASGICRLHLPIVRVKQEEEKCIKSLEENSGSPTKALKAPAPTHPFLLRGTGYMNLASFMSSSQSVDAKLDEPCHCRLFSLARS